MPDLCFVSCCSNSLDVLHPVGFGMFRLLEDALGLCAARFGPGKLFHLLPVEVISSCGISSFGYLYEFAGASCAIVL